VIKDAVVHGDADQAKINEFSLLPQNKKLGHWERTNAGGDLVNLKRHVKEHYLVKQAHTCPYCDQQWIVNHKGVWDAEHIISKNSHPQFMFEPKNLCVACKDCNTAKGEKNVLRDPTVDAVPDKPDAYLIAHPHFDNYKEHINYNIAPRFYWPTSEKGAKTIDICGLYRFAAMNTDYAKIPDENKKNVLDLATQLQNADTPAQEYLLMGMVRRMAETGMRKAEEQHN